MTKRGTKVSVVGVGAVGATAAYALSTSDLVSELVLVDVDKDRTEGEALDLKHGSGFLRSINITAGDYEDTKDSDVVVITAGVAQKPGESRLELVDRNIKIFESIIPEVAKNSPNAILLVVSNPVDVLTRVTYELSGFPRERVISSGTMLDTSRLQYEIASRFGIDTRDVNAFIMGEHGDSGFPVWSLANIKGISLDEFSKLTGHEYNESFREEVAKNVVAAAYEVINKKGATYYAIGLSIRRIVKAILGDEKAIIPVGTLVNDYYEANDVYMGMPCIIGINGVEKVLQIELTDEEAEKFNNSAKTLMDTFNQSFVKK